MAATQIGRQRLCRIRHGAVVLSKCRFLLVTSTYNSYQEEVRLPRFTAPFGRVVADELLRLNNERQIEKLYMDLQAANKILKPDQHLSSPNVYEFIHGGKQ